MEMSSDERLLDVRAMQLAPNKSRRRARPDRVLDVHYRRHQGNETKIAFNHREQRANPPAVTGSKHAELAAATFAQCTHHLPQLDHALAQPFCIADEIARDRKFAVPVAARDTRKMIRQMKETCVPAKFIEVLCVPSMTDRTSGHERMQEKHCRCVGALCASEKVRTRDVVGWKLRLDWTAPCDGRATVPERFGKIDVVWSGVVFLRCEAFAFHHVALHLCTAAPVQPVARLEEIHRRT